MHERWREDSADVHARLTFLKVFGGTIKVATILSRRPLFIKRLECNARVIGDRGRRAGPFLDEALHPSIH
jgi:hypothetical protein